MNKLIVTAVVAAGLALGSSAFAADTTSAAPAKAAAATTAKAATKTAAPKTVAAKADPKTAACEKEWKAEKTHKQSEKAYVKACVAKAA